VPLFFRRRTPNKIFYGWWIVAALFLAEFTAAGAGTFTFGLYLKPMSEDLGWSRAQVVAALTFRSVITFFVAPIIGPLLDKYGPRVIVMVGASIGGIALISLSVMDSLWHWFLAYGIGGALGLGLTGALVTQTTVSKWFVRQRGRAIAITSFGIGFGGMVMSPITQIIISNFGWREAWLIFGLMMLIVTLPTAFFILRRSPEDMGLLPDGDVEDDTTGSNTNGLTSKARQEISWTVVEAIRTPTLWLMVAAFSVNGLALSQILTHQAAYVTDKGFSDSVAAGVVTIFAGMSALANLIWGLLSDKFPIRSLVILSFIISSVGVAFLLMADNIYMLFLYLLIYGATRGVASLTGLAYANYWGRAFIGSIRGFVTPLNVAASAAGPLLAALIFDLRGSYIVAFSASLGLFLVAAALMVLAVPPKKPDSAI